MGPLLIGLVLRGKDSTPKHSTDDSLDRQDFLRIRCPECGWQPTRRDAWCCDPGCGHVWNTFETHGRCPSCDKHWQYTACHKCEQWSLHEAWYESQGRDG
jgi:hypothetical protein